MCARCAGTLRTLVSAGTLCRHTRPSVGLIEKLSSLFFFISPSLLFWEARPCTYFITALTNSSGNSPNVKFAFRTVKSLVAWLRHFSSCRRARRGGNVSAHSCSEAPTLPEEHHPASTRARAGSNGEVWPGEPGFHSPVWSSPASRRAVGGRPVFTPAAQGLTIAARSRGGAAWDNSH